MFLFGLRFIISLCFWFACRNLPSVSPLPKVRTEFETCRWINPNYLMQTAPAPHVYLNIPANGPQSVHQLTAYTSHPGLESVKCSSVWVSPLLMELIFQPGQAKFKVTMDWMFIHSTCSIHGNLKGLTKLMWKIVAHASSRAACPRGPKGSTQSQLCVVASSTENYSH